MFKKLIPYLITVAVTAVGVVVAMIAINRVGAINKLITGSGAKAA